MTLRGAAWAFLAVWQCDRVDPGRRVDRRRRLLGGGACSLRALRKLRWPRRMLRVEMSPRRRRATTCPASWLIGTGRELRKVR